MIVAIASAQPKQRMDNSVIPRSVGRPDKAAAHRRDWGSKGDPVKNLTERQLEVLDCIRDRVKTHGFPPARNEIAEALGVAHISTVD